MIRPLVAYCEKSEDVTLSYQVEVSMDHPDKFVVFERYVSKDLWESVHMKSQAVRDFNQVSAKMIKHVEFQNYQESSTGYLTRK